MTISYQSTTAYPTWKQDFYKRHKVYIHILQDLGINIVFGNFKERQVQCNSCFQRFKKHEEKQTDVNIATQIVNQILFK